MPRSTVPQHLSARSKALYRRISTEFGLSAEPHALQVLRLALEAMDRCDEARNALAKHGTTYLDRYGAPRARPEVAIERDSRLAVARLLRELSLDADLDPGYPSGSRMPRIGTGATA